PRALHLACAPRPHPPILPTHTVHDPRAAEGSGIARLPAGCRIERGPIEHEAGGTPNVAHVDDRGVELLQIRIGVVEAFGHGWRTGSSAPASRKPFARRRQLSQ